MELILNRDLDHQVKGRNAIVEVLSENLVEPGTFYFQNPIIQMDRQELSGRISQVQAKTEVPTAHRQHNAVDAYLHLDVKMETGTGKTYVYTSAMYELHRRYGFNKFILVVPTLAIKAGARQFLEDPYTLRHFREVCGYEADVQVLTLDAGKKKKGKNYFPSAVREFVAGSSQNKQKIYVLLTNMGLLGGASKQLTDTYDFGIEGFYRPVDGLKGTLPIVFIDEPHRFAKEQKAFQFIEKSICPQMLVRFGATFPEVEFGRGRNKIRRKDYHNLVYDLNSFQAFNQNLIKGIAKEHFEPSGDNPEKIRVMNIEAKKSVRLRLLQKDKAPAYFDLRTGDSLGQLSANLSGIVVEGIGTGEILLSNGQTKQTGAEFDTDIYSTSYQESMLRLALIRHFETERSNFNRPAKIKTLALFFIDDINSYRSENEHEAYLRTGFERILREETQRVINLLDENETEYKTFLEATLANIPGSHAGYFAQDNSSTDEAIAQEIQVILYEKKTLVSIRNAKGQFNTLRFLFSKWTLKEGWDNPNVFTIAKLRSSGSENSKLQEVGRGLRLPVNEFGNRVSSETFMLNYIIDFTEHDFAEKLVMEINAEQPQNFTLTYEHINRVAQKLEKDPDELVQELLTQRFINFRLEIKYENIAAFFEAYPDFQVGLQPGRVRDMNKKRTSQMVKVKKAAYDDIRELWERINEKYFLVYEPLEKESFLEEELLGLLRLGVFAEVYLRGNRKELDASGQEAMLREGEAVQFRIEKVLPYHQFLKRINRQTNLPITLLHQVLVRFHAERKLEPSKFNENSATNFVRAFQNWKIEKLLGRFKYSKANLPKRGTSLTFADGSLKPELPVGIFGLNTMGETPADKYLYDLYAYDSPLEKENLLASGIEEIVVYGKIPRKSISIPTIVGETYSPDFMYVVKKENGEKILNLVVETKDVEKQAELRGVEKAKIDCASVFFKQLTVEGYKVEFHTQLNGKKIRQIIDEVLSDD
jgi:type III restriction enzyme